MGQFAITVALQISTDISLRRLLLDTRPGQVDIEEQQEDSEADDGGIKSIIISRQRVEEKMSVHLWFDQNQVNEDNDEVELDVSVCELLASWTLCEAHTARRAPIPGCSVFGVEGLDGIAAFYADGHCCGY